MRYTRLENIRCITHEKAPKEANLRSRFYHIYLWRGKLMIKLTLLKYMFASNRDNSRAPLTEAIKSILLFCIFTDFVEVLPFRTFYVE